MTVDEVAKEIFYLMEAKVDPKIVLVFIDSIEKEMGFDFSLSVLREFCRMIQDNARREGLLI